MKILIATHNKAKLGELKKAAKRLADLGFEMMSLADIQITDAPEETGTTFEENSLLKAKYYAEVAQLPAIADDGGPLIHALNNEPGVKSRMWLGREATDQ